MSNVIPIVSSSPPPLDDDDGDFKWDDDDDDEYGNFTCAPTESGTTINSESSVDVNWSNSKPATPPHHGSSLGNDTKTQVWKEDLNISPSDRSTSEHTPVDNHSSVKGTDNHCPDLNDDGVDFQDFARFDNIDFSEDPAKASDETEDKQLDVPQDFGSHTESPPADSGQVDSAAGFTQEDEFQDFAQFNEDVAAESTNTVATNQPVFTDSSPDVSKLDTNSISSPYSTSEDVHSLGLDLSSESGASRVECAGSAPLTNTDSVYSSVSTVDSGIFSTDLSPSLQAGESSDVCLNIDKEERQTKSGSVEQNSDTFPPSEPSPSSLDNPPSLEASDGHCKAAASLSNMIIEDDLDSKTVSEYSNISCDGDVSLRSDTASSSHARVGFTNCDTADSMANMKNAEHFIENVNLPGKEEVDITVDQSGEHLEHSIRQKDPSVHSTLSTSGVAGDTGSDGPTDFVSSKVSLKPAETDDVLDFQTAGGNTVEGASSSVEVGDDLAEKFQILNTDSVNTDVNIECNTERSVLSNIVGSAQSEFLSLAVDHEKPGNLSCDIKCDDVTANSELLNKDASTCDLDSPADVGADKTFDKCHELQPGVGGEDSAEGEDTESGEFGDFSTFGCQKVEDASEVVPITFRTSICETEEGDDDDFAFNREKPPVFVDDDDDDFGEFGAAGVTSLNERTSNEIDECNQKVQPACSKSDTFTDIKENEDDDFGDFDHSEPVNEGTSWADFGSAPTYPTNSDSFVSSTTKPVVSNQIKVQKLQSVVISCFLGGSEGESCIQQTDKLTDQGQESQSADNSHGGSSVLEDESPLPLDMVVDLGLSKALEAKQQTWTLVQHPSKKDPKVRLWAHLKDMDSSHALMYGWHSSHCSKEVYTSLHIDTQNILFSHKKQAVPFFASGLGILEPIRGGGGGGVVERTKEKSSAPTTQNILLDNGRQENHHTPTVQDIPPVDFDWSSSGLTNPLTVFKAEDRVTVPSSSQPLEDMLKRTTPTAKLATNEVLSAEAIRVLERMPDLSFMQSRVLMFPVKQ